MTTTYKFSKENCQKGGWARARAWAEWRKANPSPAEREVREFLVARGIAFEVEKEITHPNGMPQFFDIFIPSLNMAIEVDGSHGWHDYSGDHAKNLKMGLYDEMKVKICIAFGIRLVCIKNSLELESVLPLTDIYTCTTIAPF